MKLIAIAALLLPVVSGSSSVAHVRPKRVEPLGPVQTISLGHSRVDPRLPVVLKLDATAFYNLQNSMNGVARWLDQDPGSVLTPNSSAVLKLEGPDNKMQTIRLKGPEVRLPINPAVDGTYRYHIEWRDRIGRWFLRFPAAESSFTIDVTRPRAR